MSEILNPDGDVYRARWSAAARAKAGYPEEKRADTLERLKNTTTQAGQQEYRRMLGKKAGKKP